VEVWVCGSGGGEWVYRVEVVNVWRCVWLQRCVVVAEVNGGVEVHGGKWRLWKKGHGGM